MRDVNNERLSKVHARPAEDIFQGHHILVPADLASQLPAEIGWQSFIQQLYYVDTRGMYFCYRCIHREFEKDAAHLLKLTLTFPILHMYATIFPILWAPGP